MIKAAIFDMDGTISDSEEIHQRTEKEALRKFGLEISQKELDSYTGSTSKFMFGDLIKKYNLEASPEDIFQTKEKLLFPALEAGLKPISGVMDLIQELKAMNLKLAVASSGHKKLVNFYLKRFQLEETFDVVITAENITSPKPDPEIFLKAAKTLEVNPEDCLVFEDAKNGVAAAKAAGMKCIGYQNSPTQDLSKADLIVDNFSKLNLKNLLK